MTSRFFVAVGAAALLGASAARADCVDGTRETSEAERAFVIRTQEAIAAAMPGAPEGWRVSETTAIDEARWRRICDGPDIELPVSYSIRYSRVDGRRDIEQEAVGRWESSVDALAPGAEEQDLLREAAAKMQRIIEITTRNGGQATAESMALTAEVEDIQSRLDALDAARNEQMLAIDAETQPRDLEAGVAVRAYSAGAWIENPEPVMVPGVALAFRSTTVNLNTPAPPTMLFLGAWQPRIEGVALHMVPDPAVPPANARVTRLVVTVNGAPERQAALIEALDLDALAALIEPAP